MSPNILGLRSRYDSNVHRSRTLGHFWTLFGNTVFISFRNNGVNNIKNPLKLFLYFDIILSELPWQLVHFLIKYLNPNSSSLLKQFYLSNHTVFTLFFIRERFLEFNIDIIKNQCI